MNGWVYNGFEKTYQTLGIVFDHVYYESNTYLLGKEIIEEGLAKGVFYRKEDGSVWIDLKEEKLDEKLVLRSDGTSVYITQDMGTADLKYIDHGCERSVYVVGNEQDYHFKVLFAILKKLGRPYAAGLYHMSYGMVELPEGRMKSREGTVVDADDLLDEMYLTAKTTTETLGKTDGMDDAEADKLYHMLGLGAIKYFLLKVDPKKRMLFNPEESVQFQGHTGPFIQYTHARIRSIGRKAALDQLVGYPSREVALHASERNLLLLLQQYAETVEQAAKEYSPALVANYVFELAKAYNRFYGELPIFNDPDRQQVLLRCRLSEAVGETIRNGMGLLGIDVPERM
jgi:arginyl-tRNA synthetase